MLNFAFSETIGTSGLPIEQGVQLPSYLAVRDGVVWKNDQPVPTPEEVDFFRVLELDWIPPQQRR